MADGLVVGINTHKDVHVAAVMDRLGRRVAVRDFLADEATAVPKDRQGVIGELRLPVITRRSAVKARAQATSQIMRILQRYIARELYPLIRDAFLPISDRALT
jgi:hypothetical protein